MTFPRPVVFVALVAAYFIGHLLTLIDQQKAKSAVSQTDLIDKSVINQRLA
jgi:hypothetical protein